MPTPTVFQNDGTHHSNVIVEGVMVQRAFFSNPPSECGSDPPQLNRGNLLSANTFLSQDVRNEVDTAAPATEEADAESTQRSNGTDVETDSRIIHDHRNPNMN